MILQVLPSEQIGNLYRYIQLGATAVIALGLLGIVGKLIDRLMKQQAAREIAQRIEEREFRRAILATQERIAVTLDNHLGEIGRHMATQTELNRMYLEEKRRDNQRART